MKQKQNWIGFVKQTWGDLKRTNKKASFKDAMKEASRRKKNWKHGGATAGVATNAAAVNGGEGADSIANESGIDAAVDNEIANMDAKVTSVMGGKRRKKRTARRRSSIKKGGRRRTRRRTRRR